MSKSVKKMYFSFLENVQFVLAIIYKGEGRFEGAREESLRRRERAKKEDCGCSPLNVYPIYLILIIIPNIIVYI